MANKDGNITVKNKLIKESFLDFLYESYLAGNWQSEENINLLKKHGYIKDVLPRQPIGHTQHKTKRDFTVSHEIEIDADSYIKIQYISGIDLDKISLENKILEEYDESDIQPKILKVSGAITKEQWLPESIIYHKKDFVNWIDSINSGFQNKIHYNKFALYCQQADDWYSENDSIVNYHDIDEQKEYIFQEFDRCRDNVLYFANKYGYLVDETQDSGRLKFYAGENYDHLKIICYLNDCGYSFILGKPRQVGGTTIHGLIALRDTTLRSNFFTKFITKDKTLAGKQLDEKIKYPYGELPEFFKLKRAVDANEDESCILNDTETLFNIGIKSKKGNGKGINSKIEIVAPTKTAINGGAPPKVYIDEADDVRGLSEMMTEARPTMFKKVNNKLKQVRQLIIWSTGTSLNAGGDFEIEWNKYTALWNKREFGAGIIPLFFDWTTRCDYKTYQDEKLAYSGGIDGKSIYQFYQHFPSTPADMFRSYDNTLIDREIIEKNIDKIYNSELEPCQFGYFEPEYDKSIEYDEKSYVPYKIIGANWMPCDELNDRCSTIIFQHPKREWINRYYQGTDPISSSTGLSKMASSIWDEYYHTISAITNIRKSNNPNYSLLQSMVVGIYYDVKKELAERNIILPYQQFKEHNSFVDNMVINSELPDYLSSGELSEIGVDNKGDRNKTIIERMREMVRTYGDRIFIQLFWEQHRTFVGVNKKTGYVKWGTKDARIFNDDTLFATVYSYICASCFNSTLHPTNTTSIKDRNEEVEYEFNYDSNWNLTRQIVRN